MNHSKYHVDYLRRAVLHVVQGHDGGWSEKGGSEGRENELSRDEVREAEIQS